MQFSGIKYIHNVVCPSPSSFYRTLHPHPKQKLFSLNIHSPTFPLLSSDSFLLSTTTWLSISMNLPILGTSYRWNHAVFVLLCQSTSHNVFKVHAFVACIRSSFLRLNFLPIYLSTHTYILLIHSPVDGIWVFSTFWLLWITLLWTLVYKYLFQFLLLIWGVYA